MGCTASTTVQPYLPAYGEMKKMETQLQPFIEFADLSFYRLIPGPSMEVAAAQLSLVKAIQRGTLLEDLYRRDRRALVMLCHDHETRRVTLSFRVMESADPSRIDHSVPFSKHAMTFASLWSNTGRSRAAKAKACISEWTSLVYSKCPPKPFRVLRLDLSLIEDIDDEPISFTVIPPPDCGQ